MTAETIRLGIPAANSEQAIRKAGEILVATGSVEPRYVQAMVDLVKQLGPYIVLAPGIALAHARPENGVKRICLALITLAEPVCFGNAANDPVDIVAAMGAVDSENHVQILAQLAGFLGDETNMARLRKARDPLEACALVTDFVRRKASEQG